MSENSSEESTSAISNAVEEIPVSIEIAPPVPSRASASRVQQWLSSLSLNEAGESDGNVDEDVDSRDGVCVVETASVPDVCSDARCFEVRALRLESQGSEWLKAPSSLSSCSAHEVSIPEIFREACPRMFEKRISTAAMRVPPVINAVGPDVVPIFCKARPIPINLKVKAEVEIKQLEQDGVITRTNYSRWASPLVIVRKKNTDKLRLCVDFKVTLNKVITNVWC